MEKITVLKVSPLHKPEVISISHTLESLQHIVNGSIQAIYPFEDPVTIICNEEGKLLGMEPNRAIRDPDTGELVEVICGAFLVSGLTRDDFDSLPEPLIRKYSKLFQYPELFLWDGSQLMVLPMVG